MLAPDVGSASVCCLGNALTAALLQAGSWVSPGLQLGGWERVSYTNAVVNMQCFNKNVFYRSLMADVRTTKQDLHSSDF